MKHYTIKSDIGVALFIASILFITTGWFLNLINIFNHTGDMTGEFFVRIIGVFVFFIGGIAGWL